MTEENEVIEPGTEERCEECDHIKETLAAFSLTAACHYVDDDEKRKECVDWAENVDPETIDSFMVVAKELVNKAGIDAINLMTSTTNDVLHTAMIEAIKEKLDAGETVPEHHMKIYKALTIRRGL